MPRNICDIGPRLNAEGRTNPGWYVTLPVTNYVLGPYPTEQKARQVADAIDEEIERYQPRNPTRVETWRPRKPPAKPAAKVSAAEPPSRGSVVVDQESPQPHEAPAT